MAEAAVHPHLLKQYGVFADRGILAPISGTASVRLPGLDARVVPIHFYVGPDGDVWLWFSGESFPPAATAMFTSHSGEFEITGQLADGSSFSAPRCLVVQWGLDGRSGVLRQTSAGLQIVLTEPADTTVLVIANSEVELTNGHQDVNVEQTVAYTLVNAIFEGLDFGPRDANGRQPRDRFDINHDQRTWKFEWLPSFDRNVSDDLNAGLASRLPTALATTTIPANSSVDARDEEILALLQLLALAAGAHTAPVARECRQNGRWFHRQYGPYHCPTDAKGNRNFGLIKNSEPDNGLKNFLEASLPIYRARNTELRFDKAIGYLIESRHAKFVEVRLLLAILGLELTTYQLCRSYGQTEDQLKDSNIQDKLRSVNRHLRFIESRFTDPDLRAEVRNPLMHSGQIPAMTFHEMDDWADDLQMLHFRILLLLLGYTGQYLDPMNGYQLVDAPQTQPARRQAPPP